MNSKNSAKFSLIHFARFMAGTYIAHLILGELAMMPALVFRPSPSSIHISGVVLFSSKIQMVRTDARRIVAVVKHAQAIWNRANIQLVRDAMRAACDYMAFRANADRAITLVRRTASPEPAGFRLIDLRPESLLKQRFHEGLATSQAAEFTATVFQVAGGHLETLAALLTGAWYFITSHDVHSPKTLVNRLVRLVSVLIALMRAVSILPHNATTLENSLSGDFS